MNTNPNPDSDTELRDVLQKWKVDATPSPRFQERVWSRIARSAPEARPTVLGVLAGRIESFFRRPALALAYCAVLLFLGSSAGYLQGAHKTAEARSQFEAMYVQSVDPYQISRNSP